VGRKCAVQRLDDGFTTMEDTSSFGLWAWMPSPHRIPKVLWCTLVNKGAGGLSSKVASRRIALISGREASRTASCSMSTASRISLKLRSWTAVSRSPTSGPFRTPCRNAT